MVAVVVATHQYTVVAASDAANIEPREVKKDTSSYHPYFQQLEIEHCIPH